MLDVFVERGNAEFGQKDWQDGSFFISGSQLPQTV
jgi:hypothetical protein